MSIGAHKRSRIVETLARAIRSGELKPGDQLDGENELARRFAVSRGTIRHALQELQQRNLIATRSGIGSFVTFDGVALDQSLGWARALRSAGSDITTEVLDIASVPWDTTALPPEALTDAALAADHAVRVRRIRRLPDGTAVSYESSFLPATGILADLPVTGLIDGSIWATLQRAGIRPVSGSQQVRLVPLGADDARILDRPEGCAFLGTARTSFGADGGFVEHVAALLDPDHFRIVINFGGTL
ncbi:GntR family transcriptional regulator [Streptomyces spiralis]